MADQPLTTELIPDCNIPDRNIPNPSQQNAGVQNAIGHAIGQNSSEQKRSVKDPSGQFRSAGWILVLVFVGLWIGIAGVWRKSEPQPIVKADYTVDVNQASEMDLLNLPEVGPSLAERILAYRREHGDFHGLADLGKVPGVGPQTLKQLAPFLIFTTRSDPNDPVGLDE